MAFIFKWAHSDFEETSSYTVNWYKNFYEGKVIIKFTETQILDTLNWLRKGN